MKALGEMAGGVAHEINNPLTIVIGLANSLYATLRNAGVPAELYTRNLDRIVATSQRIASIVKGLRVFSRFDDLDPFERADLSLIARDTLSLCAERFRMAGISLDAHLDEGFFVSCRPTQVSQVILNLLNNAFDAVKPLEERWVRVGIERCSDDPRVGNKPRHLFRVTDSGPGVPENLIDKVMQPFFTTKEPGKGTGLGLSVSSGIVQAHGGTLRYEKNAGHTSFCIELPVTEEFSSSHVA